MVAPWRLVSKPQPVIIVAPDGRERCRPLAYFNGSVFIIEDMKAVMEPGDEIRRQLPNGQDDVYSIDDPCLYHIGMTPAHYQVRVSRKGIYNHATGGNYISVTGPNARVNIGPTDNSPNVVNSGDVFGQMRQAIETGVQDPTHRNEILAAINQAEKIKGTFGFLAEYQKIVSVSADHLGILLPFLPALTSLLGLIRRDID